MQDDELRKLLKQETPYLADEGFSQKVMDRLPRTAQYRRRVIGASWVLSLIAGLVLWASGAPSLTVFSIQPGILLSAATLTFWAVLGLFVFVAKDEGIVDL